MSLPYWIEATDARVFIKMPGTLKANATRQFALVKQDGYSANIDDVMIDADLFDDDSVSTKYTVLQESSGSISESSGTLTISTTNGLQQTAHGLLSSINCGSSNLILECNMRIGSGDRHGGIGLTAESSPKVWQHSGGNGCCIYLRNYAHSDAVASSGDGTNWDSGTYLAAVETSDHNYKIVLSDSDIKFYYEGTLFDTCTVLPSSNLHMYIGTDDYDNGDTVFYANWVFVRKYVSTEPTVTVEDKGSHYLVTVTNNDATDYEDLQVYFNAADISLASVDESLKITEGGPKYLDVMGINIIR